MIKLAASTASLRPMWGRVRFMAMVFAFINMPLSSKEKLLCNSGTDYTTGASGCQSPKSADARSGLRGAFICRRDGFPGKTALLLRLFADIISAIKNEKGNCHECHPR